MQKKGKRKRLVHFTFMIEFRIALIYIYIDKKEFQIH